MRDNGGVIRMLQRLGLCLAMTLLVASCDDDETDQLEHQDLPASVTRPDPMPQKETLGVRTGLPEVPSKLSTGLRYELYSKYQGQDIRQVTGVSGRTLWLCFTAPWCPHSANMIRELKQLAQEEKGNVQVVEVDADTYPTLAEQFGITKVPSTFLYTEGVKLRTIEGAYNAASLRRYLHRVLTRQEEAQPGTPASDSPSHN